MYIYYKRWISCYQRYLRDKELNESLFNKVTFNGIEKIASKEEDNGVNIYIGSENNFDDDVTVIKTKYIVNGEEGTIALIGPKRMEYERVVALLNFIKENIDK